MTGNAKRVLILGHGAMGRAFESLLSSRHDVAVWDRDLTTGVETEPLEQIARDRQVVAFAMPTDPHDELAQRLAACASGDVVCLSIAKGLDAKGRTSAQIFERNFGARIGWALIYGPMLARELQAGRAGFAMVASRRPEVGESVMALFAGTTLRLQPTDDVHGAAWAAILKNVYVPLIGAAEGLGLGDNLRGFLIAEAARELGNIAEQMGGRRETAYTLAGLGDLVTSATSASSHHRHIGAELAAGRTGELAASGVNIRSEGVHTMAIVRDQAVFEWEQFPLFALVCNFLNDPAQLEKLLADYLAQRFG
jgi:glycerol-3-phosphate dehydrogenase (NAD(P)+)